MPLTHVCVWDSKIGYRRITVEEACKMYPYGASARSGHFVCELCAQNVLLTAPGMNAVSYTHLEETLAPVSALRRTTERPFLLQSLA